MALTERDQRAIARVAIGPETRGTAFLATPRHAITARHVVANATAPIELTFPGHAAVTAKLLAKTDPKLDWALLECAPPAGVTPLRLAHFDPEQDREWSSRGHGGLWKGAAGPLKGTFYSESPLELSCDTIRTEVEAKGFSGAPLVTTRGVVGIISFTRADSAGLVKAGFAGAVATGAIIADWPAAAGQAPIDPDPAPYALALEVCLSKLLENSGLRKILCYELGLASLANSAVGAERLAERMVEAPWSELCRVIGELAHHAPPELHDLVGSMWVCREAAKKLVELMDRRVVLAIQTELYDTVRHHVMRAQGEKHRRGRITWGDQWHMFRANVHSGEVLKEVVESVLARSLAVEPEELADYLADPTFVAVNVIPSGDDVGAVTSRFGVQMIVYSATATKDAFDRRRLAAELVEPSPDRELEAEARRFVRRSKETHQ